MKKIHAIPHLRKAWERVAATPIEPELDLRYTRWAGEKLPKWARKIHEYNTLCECEALPVIAGYTLEVVLPRNQGIRKIRQTACPVCLKILASERNEFDAQKANALYESFQPPKRDGSLYALKRVFGDFSKSRLLHWKRAGLVLYPRPICLKAGYPTPTVDYKHLLAFMKEPDTWRLWQHEAVLDPELRAWITRVREYWPWYWLSTHLAATALGYSQNGLWKHAKLLGARLGPTPHGRGAPSHAYRSDRIAWFQAEMIPEQRMGGVSCEATYREPFTTIDAYIPLRYRHGIADIGGGNFSRGVRRLYEWHLEGEQAEHQGENGAA